MTVLFLCLTPCSALSPAPVIHGDIDSCGLVQGSNVHVDSYGVVHANSGGAVVHRKSWNSHGADVHGGSGEGTQPVSMSTRCMDGRPAAGKLASSQQA